MKGEREKEKREFHPAGVVLLNQQGQQRYTHTHTQTHTHTHTHKHNFYEVEMVLVTYQCFA